MQRREEKFAVSSCEVVAGGLLSHGKSYGERMELVAKILQLSADAMASGCPKHGSKI